MSSGRAPAVLAVLAIEALGCSPTVVWYGHSPDRRHEVEIVESLSSQSVRLDGEQGEAFLGIAPEALLFSPDGKRLAYAAQDAEGWHLVVNGASGPGHEGIGDVAFSPDGKSMAYVALDRDRWQVFRNGEADPAFAALLEGTLRFSADGVHLAYVARTTGGVSAVLDGRVGPSYDGIANLAFAAPDGELGYVARRGQHSRLVLDGIEGPAFDAIGEVVFASGHSAYGALQEPGWVAVLDGVVQQTYDRVDAFRLTSDGRHWAYVARREQRHYVVRDGIESEPYAQVDQRTLGFAPDGRLAYAAISLGPADPSGARTAAGLRMVLDGSPGASFDALEPPVFAPRGKRWGYVGKRAGQAFVVLDGRESVPYRWASDLTFSQDGTQHAYLARQARAGMVVRNDSRTALPPLVRGSLVLDDTGRHFACVVAVRSVRQFYLVVDGLPLRVFDLGELAAALALLPADQQLTGRIDAALIRRWVRAELELELERNALELELERNALELELERK
jgi:hypothetical protein